MSVALNIIAKESGKVEELMVEMFMHSIDGVFDQIVFVDNGCSNNIVDIVQKYKNRGNSDWKYIEFYGNHGFDALRNKALQHSIDSGIDWVVWHDCDDVINRNDYEYMIKNIMSDKEYTRITQRFYHFMGSPFCIQIERSYHVKNNIFKITKDTKWGGGVHEGTIGIPKGKNFFSKDMAYFHFGYGLKPSYQIFLRWLKYDMISDGNLKRYKEAKEGVEWNLDHGNPMGVIESRLRDNVVIPFIGVYPESCRILFDEYFKNGRMIQNNILENVREFQKWLIETNNDPIWIEWQKKKEECGNWYDTYDWAVEKFIGDGK